MKNLKFTLSTLQINIVYKSGTTHAFRAWVNYTKGTDKTPKIYDNYNDFVARMRYEGGKQNEEIFAAMIHIDYLTEKKLFNE